jgi:hypothetical protein
MHAPLFACWRRHLEPPAATGAPGLALSAHLLRSLFQIAHKVFAPSACARPKSTQCPRNATSRRVMFEPRLYFADDVLADGIIVTPTHVRLAPSRARRIVGIFRHTQPVLQALGLETVAA